jgi:hypothetical protein
VLGVGVTRLHPELSNQIQMEEMEVSTDAEQEQAESDEDERQQDRIDHLRQTTHASGDEPDNRKREGRQNDDQSRVDDLHVPADVAQLLFDLVVSRTISRHATTTGAVYF